MKFILIAFAVLAAVVADVSELPSNEYLPPVPAAAPIQEYLPPVPAPFDAEPAHELAQDGYRYKTVKRYRFRHRRDVNELPSNEYLPPVQEAAPIAEPIAIPAPFDAEPAHELAQDGYRYKTVKRYRFRHRRDVNELPSNEYLPPVQEAAPIAEPIAIPAPFDAEPAHELAQDGYRYKTVKRYRFRHRRDVNELPSNEYLPPVQEAAPIAEPIAIPAPFDAEPAHELAQDGYRYKTVKRYRFRHRRDVNELPSNEYLPPVPAPAPVPTQEYLPPVPAVVAEPAHELANDGYRYKTVKRYRLRHRRDVNELPSNEYLPPVEAVAVQEAAIGPAPFEAEPAHELAQDGYRYKTVKRYRFRHRRDVNELPSNEYLPPVPAPAPTQEYLPPVPAVEAEPAHELANDGYRYKTVKRYRLRHRRDVNELPSNEYLPPVEAVAVQEAAIGPAPFEAEPAHELAQDGYRYKTVKRYRFRHRRDVNELPSNEYLPPVPAPAPTQEYLPPVPAVEAEPAHELANDGYRYKTVKRYRLRHRRDVNELPSNEYLPPVEAVAVQEAAIGPAPFEAEPAHELAQDGYRYKTVKRYRFRHRRDVNELPSNEYLPPVPAPAPVPTQEYLPPVPAPFAAEPGHELAQDGYRYKTVKRYRFRHRA